jgi:hypothetical protein
MTEYPPGWTCERTGRRFEYYLLNTLALGDALAIAEHLEACDCCAQRLVFSRLTLVERPRV